MYRILPSAMVTPFVESPDFVVQLAIAHPDDSIALYANIRLDVRTAARWFEVKLSDRSFMFDRAVATNAMYLVAIPRIERGLMDGAFDELMEQDDLHRLTQVRVSDEDLERLSRTPKRCSHQVTRGRELFCETGGNPPLATTRHGCSRCDLPDDRVVCSHLHHALVRSVAWMTIRLVGVVCELGRDERAAGATKCAPQGNDCWERVVALPEVEPTKLHPLAVHELIEFIDALWMVIFPKKRLLAASSLTVGPKLMPPCVEDRSHFEAKLSAVGEMFNALTVDQAILGDRKDISGSLALMRAALEKKAAEVKLSADRIEQLRKAFETLSLAMGLRASAQHAAAKGRLPRAAAAYELNYPLASYADAWDRIYARLAEELRTVRDCMREIVQAAID